MKFHLLSCNLSGNLPLSHCHQILGAAVESGALVWMGNHAGFLLSSRLYQTWWQKGMCQACLSVPIIVASRRFATKRRVQNEGGCGRWLGK